MKRPLRCVDLDPVDPDPSRPVGRACQKEYLAYPPGKKFFCRNYNANNGRCQRGAWLYPRKWSNKGYWHFHQGIDLGGLDPETPEARGRKDAGGLPVLSVSSGEVSHVAEWDGEKPGYGTVVGILDDKTNRLYWYAHLEADSPQVRKGERVEEGQVIARVGNTGKAGAPHLHFEVIDAAWQRKGGRYHPYVIGGLAWEQGIGDLYRDSPRLDPLKVLEELGPWGPRRLFDPGNFPATREWLDEQHRTTETAQGGFFPLGANNFWHGGIHYSPADDMIHSPLPGRIVACRLGSDPTTASGAFGDLNFVLIRHEVPDYILAEMAAHGGVGPPPVPVPSAGGDAERGRISKRVKADNPPNLVRKLAAELRERGFYGVDDATVESGKLDEQLQQAMEAYQATLRNPYVDPEDPDPPKKPKPWPDGIIDVPGYTWGHLFPEPATDDDDDADDDGPARTDNVLYCLLMHLAPLAIDDVAEHASWISRARLGSPSDTGDDDTGDDDGYGAGEVEGAPPDADHILSGSVKKGSMNAADVEWVEQRLIDLALLTDRSEPTGVADEAFDAALRTFQRTYVWPNDPANCDGVVSIGHRTDTLLRKDDETLAEIAADIAEVESYDLTDNVFEGSVDADDIRWVEARLIRRGMLDRQAPTGVADAELAAAIVEFQRAYPWPHKPKNCDGIVTKNQKTHDYLRRTGVELELGGGSGGSGGGGGGKGSGGGAGRGSAPDPAFVEAVNELGPDGLAAVVSGLSVPIAAGEPIWPCGVSTDRSESGVETPRAEIHWELFSEALLFPEWDCLEDAGDDLVADVPSTLLSEIDRDRNTILSASEVARFYADEPEARELRRTPCRFLSEWGTDLDCTVARLDAMGFGTAGLKTELEPYQWWARAADVLPASPKVWHYNPIELLAVYQELLDRHAPPTAIDAATQGNIMVRVIASNGMPAKSPPTVAVYWAGQIQGQATVGKDGTALFHRLVADRQYFVVIVDEDDRFQVVDVSAGATAEVELSTARTGRAIPYGDLTVWVRKHGDSAAVGAIVTMTDASGTTHGPLTIGKRSRVVFEDLPPGKLTIDARLDQTPSGQDPHPNDRVEASLEVDFAGKNRKVTLMFESPVSDVTVHYDDAGLPTYGTLDDGAGNWAELPTLGNGVAKATVPRGKYKVKFGKTSRKLNVRFATMEYVFE